MILDDIRDNELAIIVPKLFLKMHKCPDIFQKLVLTNALLDRLLHHCHVVPINGQAYRLKNQLQYLRDNNQNEIDLSILH